LLDGLVVYSYVQSVTIENTTGLPYRETVPLEKLTGSFVVVVVVVVVVIIIILGTPC